MSDFCERAKQLLDEQKAQWPLLRDNAAALKSVMVKSVDLGDFVMKVQFNPGRLTSTVARTDPKTIRERKCFLCDENRPPEQRGLPFGEDFQVLCNPFPIFPEHFTVNSRTHRPQKIRESFDRLVDLAQAMSPRYSVFYNGPKCGASAPDHLHFQAGDRRFMTIENEYERLKGKPIVSTRGLEVYAPRLLRPFVALESSDREAMLRGFEAFHRNFNNVAPDSDEPMMNLLGWHDAGVWRMIILPRARHRPSIFFAEGDAKVLLSPASVDLGGVCIVPVEKDFHRIDRPLLEEVLAEVMLQPEAFGRLSDALAAVLG